MYRIVRTRKAEKDIELLKSSHLNNKAMALLEIIERNPYERPVEKLINLNNTYSKRINGKHRLVYEVFEDIKTIKVISLWGHYDDN
ncbi:MAG: Txe/YoeB family addiction module toxin [Roseburia sp.]|nr:Txe/YoeB family addiction module toxin [Roseburia sp.]